jgi:hypothetical protein
LTCFLFFDAASDKSYQSSDRVTDDCPFTAGDRHDFPRLVDQRVPGAELKLALDSYTARDSEVALDVRDRDIEIDELNNSLFSETLSYMSEGKDRIASCTQLLFCIKNLERIGDHVTNIAEGTYYIVLGHPPSTERKKGNNADLKPFNSRPSGTASH